MVDAEKSRRRAPRRWWLDVLLVLAVFAGVRACQSPQVGEGPLPALSGTTLTGDAVSLQPGQGPTVLHFWATWCGVCEAQAPNVAALAEDTRVITVASRSGSDAQVEAHLAERGLDFPVINDPGGRLAARFGVRAYPTTFVVDSDGEAAATEVGYTTLWGLRARVWWAGLWGER